MDIKQYLEKNKRSSLAQPKKNFTLVELAVVITTIGTLAAIVIPNATNKVADARVSALKQDIAHIEQALMQHEIENPEVPVLSKVEASELGSKLKSTVEKELNDDASDVYRIDMKVLKDYLHKTKYGHLEDDAKEDEYFFSKKTNRVYYEKGYSTSKGYRVHYMGSGNVKMQNAIKDLKPVKIITTLPVTYYLLANGDLYAEGYNYYGLMMQQDKITKGETYGSSEYIPLKKIASSVKELHIPSINTMANGEYDFYFGYTKLDNSKEIFTVSTDYEQDAEGEWIEVTSLVRKNVGNVGDGFEFNSLAGQVLFVDDKHTLRYFSIGYESGKPTIKEDLAIDDVKRILPKGIGYETLGGEYISFDYGGAFVNLADDDPNKGQPLTFVRFTTNGQPLFKINNSLYLPAEGYSSVSTPIDATTTKDVEGITDENYIYKNLSDDLFLGTGEKIAEGVSEAYLMTSSHVLYRKGASVYNYSPEDKASTKLVDNAKSLHMYSKGRGLYQPYKDATHGVIQTNDDALYGVNYTEMDSIYLPDEYEKGKPVVSLLEENVASFKPSETNPGIDSLIVKKKDGTTVRSRLTLPYLNPMSNDQRKQILPESGELDVK